LCVALLFSYSLSARAEEGAGPDQAAQAGSVGDFPKKLAIIIVAKNSVISTFEQRVSSWFNDGTEVHVSVRSEVDQQQLLASSPGTVSAWIVTMSSERAIVSFSGAAGQSPAVYLVREVRLRNGLDDLGQERLASVVHSAFVALREGAEGFERAHAERELGDVGLAPASPTPRAIPEGSLAPPVARLPDSPVPRSEISANDLTPARAVKPPSWLLFGVGYGGQLRVMEGVGHGPSLTAGVRLPSKRMPIDLLVKGQFLVPSGFEAELFSATVQTTAVRFQFGVEPELGPSYWGQALVGAGADVAQIRSSATQSANDGAVSAGAHAAGTHWRSVGDLTLGVLRHSEVFDLGLYAQVTFFFADVHYSATTDNGDRRLVTPWPVQPGLSFQGRFRSAL
jgi:hypothetical protein